MGLSVWRTARRAKAALPLIGCRVPAGFPSPADDFIEQTLDLNDLLITNAPATFFVRASGHSMTGAGIFPNTLLVVDRSLKPANGRIVVAVVDGELTVKRLKKLRGGGVELVAEHADYEPIRFTEGRELVVWGVVKAVISNV
jgi:DNA polymerase V